MLSLRWRRFEPGPGLNAGAQTRRRWDWRRQFRARLCYSSPIFACVPSQ